MIKVLGLALYGPLAASNRYRFGQYVRGLADQGIRLDVRHLLGNDYLQKRFGNHALPLVSMMKAGLVRLGDLLCQGAYDLIVLNPELYPLLPAALERMMLCKPYIYDYDDAFYLKYRQGRFGMLQPILGNKVDRLIGGAAAVTAGNRVLFDYAKKLNPECYELPTVVDTKRYFAEPKRREDAPFTIGWIGSPSTAPYLAELVAPLTVLGGEGRVRLVVIGGKAPRIPQVDVVEIPWQEDTEVALINSFDVGVMPLPDDEWARGKCAFKLIQYMACAVPVVASPVGANIDVVTRDCGFLAASTQEWIDAFRVLRDNAGLRMKLGEAARSRVVRHYSLERNLPVLAEVIRKVARKKGEVWPDSVDKES